MKFKTEPEAPSLLAQAVTRGVVGGIESVLRDGADVNETDRRGRTPLFLALALGNPEVIDLLLSHGADPNHADCDGQTPLMVMAYEGCANRVGKLLAAGATKSLSNYDREHFFALFYAVMGNHEGVVSILLAHGADPNQRQVEIHNPRVSGESALHQAIRDGQINIFKLLVNGGVDLFQATSGGGTYLHRAVASQEREMTLFLIEAGLDLDHRDSHGRTCWEIASQGKWSEELAGVLAEREARRLAKATPTPFGQEGRHMRL